MLMPNRIIKESICTSENINNLLPAVEIFFYRLIVNCDDYGRFHASPAILRAKCFPWRTDSITLDQICEWLAVLVKETLVAVYKFEGKPYLQMVTWEKHQQIRAKKSKYPDPVGVERFLLPSEINCNQLQANVPVIQSNPIVIQSESNTVAEEEKTGDNRPNDYVKFYCNNINIAPGKYEIDTLAAYETEGMEPGVILKALEEAVTHDAKTIAYITTILNAWHKAKVRNLEQLETYRQNRKKAQGKTSPGRPKDQPPKLNEYGEDKFGMIGWGKNDP